MCRAGVDAFAGALILALTQVAGLAALGSVLYRTYVKGSIQA
jgi:hypothetical protein